MLLSRAPEPEPKERMFNLESLRERFGTLPEERMLIYTCVSDDGLCCMYLDDQESRRGKILRITYLGQNRTTWESCPLDTIELLLKQNPEVVLNKREVYPGHEFSAALADLMKYGDEVMPRSEQVADKLESYPTHYSIDEAEDLLEGSSNKPASTIK